MTAAHDDVMATLRAKAAFDEWLYEPEGFSIRAERFAGDVEWLRAAFEEGVAAERERCAEFLEKHQTIIAGESADPMMGEMINSIRAGV